MYKINEMFYSLQGEGIRVGTPNVFIRMAGCDLRCDGEVVDGLLQPVCDTEFASGRSYDSAEEVIFTAESLLPAARSHQDKSVIFTGGEPGLQLDFKLMATFREAGWYLAVETNGRHTFPVRPDWVCCSPKTAEHTLKLVSVDELRYVRNHTQGIPKPAIRAANYLISPAWTDDSAETRRNIKHCVQLVKDNPGWRLSIQAHKLLGIS